MNNGYVGNRMSVRAANCYDENIKPMSQWTKQEIIEILETYDFSDKDFSLNDIKKVPAPALKHLFLSYDSWHHTGSYFNETSFYRFDDEILDVLTKEEINATVQRIKEESKKEKEKKSIEEKWKCEYLVWSGTRKHPKAEKKVSIGTIKGNWFYLPDGSKKSVNAKGFEKLERIG